MAFWKNRLLSDDSLYYPAHEHDACGVGMVAQISGTASHDILQLGLHAIAGLMHRGALDADACTGDGAGITTQIPYHFFAELLAQEGISDFLPEDLGIGMFFLPHQDREATQEIKKIAEEVFARRKIPFLCWREVPTRPELLGPKALETMPQVEQAFLLKPTSSNSSNAGDGGKVDTLSFDRALFLARKEIEHHLDAKKLPADKNGYILSLSSRLIVYKGLFVSSSLQKFYPDLEDARFTTAFALYHQRYSTNTFPTWSLAHPFRMLAHNGEINTIRGNRNRLRACESELTSEFWGEEEAFLHPMIPAGDSDSASLDNVLELLTLSGRSLLHAMTMLVPPAWHADQAMRPELAAFYRYHETFCEAWDGPAALAFTDGSMIAACLDRNGLRPARYEITQEGVFSLSSEMGVSGLNQSSIIEKGRLAPGEMIAIDTVAGKLLRDQEIKQQLATEVDYQALLQPLVTLPSAEAAELIIPRPESTHLIEQQLLFGYSKEELKMILEPMIESGAEPVGSMGDDIPLAVLSRQPRLLYSYFKQLFAQVTNPPIDPIRERLVMTLRTTLGWKRNLLAATKAHAEQVSLEGPILFPQERAKIEALGEPHRVVTLPTLWSLEGEPTLIPANLELALEALCAASQRAIDQGARILILSDRGASATQAPIPMLLAIGRLNHYLTQIGKRRRVSLVAQTGEARDVHQMACLIGYGAHAIEPYLAYQSIAELVEQKQAKAKEGEPSLTVADAFSQYRKALEKGLLKIMSKMGISLLSSYAGAQIFEAIGIGQDVIKECFSGTDSPLEGIGYQEIAAETLLRHAEAFPPATKEGPAAPLSLSDPGYYRFRRNGERHVITPPVIKNFHTFVRTEQANDYEHYVNAVLEANPHSLRHLLEYVPKASGPIPLEAVEPIEAIRQRFTTAGMSLGALSPEAHETLAIAMNRIGGKSNSGEGGEDPKRFLPYENGDWANSAIKQIASGRFGVSAAYLASAREIEIKMAQGAKPGEGGQLPGKKVSFYIAGLRHSTPGVTLISPPPHHDIYSIEDLAQLIYDLKQVNPRARICVKLVAEAGVGTIAAGVAKASADIILISGHEGGTGASPLSSIKNAGSCWELGVAQTHQVLLLNQLRNRVTLRTDGGMRTGEDIIYATLLGAEEYNFGTAALIAMGCVYVRQCHLNNCPVGVATLDERLRAKFKGKPENVVAFFNAVAGEVRQIMARLGFATIEEMVGQTSSLRQREIVDHPKANKLQLDRLLNDVVADQPRAIRYSLQKRNVPENYYSLDDQILKDAHEALEKKHPITLSYQANNTHRSIGTKLSGEIAHRYGRVGLPEGTINLEIKGTVGQSLGAFLAPGVRLRVTGEGNDYIGKSMSGGEIILKPIDDHLFEASSNSIVGNTLLYGATGGRLFAAGRAGERFAVRNSGAQAVIEGIGDHGCEYMTGGLVVVLGGVGKNFGAGMTGGKAFVLDPTDHFLTQCNQELIVATRPHLENEVDEINELHQFLWEHHRVTGSAQAATILEEWLHYQNLFWRVAPR